MHLIKKMRKVNIDENSPLIMVGDWNSIFDGNFDKAGGKKQGGNIVESMQEIINSFDLVDIRRLRRGSHRGRKLLLYKLDLITSLFLPPCKT